MESTESHHWDTIPLNHRVSGGERHSEQLASGPHFFLGGRGWVGGGGGVLHVLCFDHGVIVLL